MNMKTDIELVISIREGDILAFEEIVKRYQRSLYFFVMGIVHDEAASLDVVQESLFKIYQVIDRVDVTKKFSTYLFEIAKNNAISYLRKNKRTVSIEHIAELEDDEPFIEKFLRQDLAELVQKAVRSLPKQYRTVITLYYFEDMSYEEISNIVHLPINTVRTHLKRAKEKLQKQILL
jgi:RNA polymerase sigma-70 factor (family 1)